MAVSRKRRLLMAIIEGFSFFVLCSLLRISFELFNDPIASFFDQLNGPEMLFVVLLVFWVIFDYPLLTNLKSGIVGYWLNVKYAGENGRVSISQSILRFFLKLPMYYVGINIPFELDFVNGGVALLAFLLGVVLMVSVLISISMNKLAYYDYVSGVRPMFCCQSAKPELSE